MKAEPVSQLSAIPSLEKLIAEIDREIDIFPSADRKMPVRSYSRKQYIRFLLGDMLFAIPLSAATEIGHLPNVTPLPNLPEWVMGVSNIRGEIISIADIKLFFGLPSQGVKRDSRFIVIRDQNMKVGLIVDKVIGIFSIDHNEIEIQENPYQKSDDAGVSAYVSGIVITQDGLMNLMDTDKLLSSPLMNAFRDE
jgi:purine-binding chemotaxis protein CheW